MIFDPVYIFWDKYNIFDVRKQDFSIAKKHAIYFMTLSFFIFQKHPSINASRDVCHDITFIEKNAAVKITESHKWCNLTDNM